MKFEGMGGPGMTIGQVIADSTRDLTANGTIREAANGWRYVQVSPQTHLTIRPSGLADHSSTYGPLGKIGSDPIR
ncbi:MAG: hypothetical protein GY719_31120 [bacterium]|nr:hypothetical protein [bacterium]